MFQSQGHLKQHVHSVGGPHLNAWNSGITSVERFELQQIDTSSPNPPQAPQAAQTINYIINIHGGTNIVSQGPSEGPNKRRKK
jgi:hypothetical protein